jgi:hypothetical protein
MGYRLSKIRGSSNLTIACFELALFVVLGLLGVLPLHHRAQANLS